MHLLCTQSFVFKKSPTLMGSCSQNGDFELNMTTFGKLSIENSHPAGPFVRPHTYFGVQTIAALSDAIFKKHFRKHKSEEETVFISQKNICE